MEFDAQGIPVSNMDELTAREEGGELVFYDCRGEVFARYPKPEKEGKPCS